jgi:hypothetical protein
MSWDADLSHLAAPVGEVRNGGDRLGGSEGIRHRSFVATHPYRIGADLMDSLNFVRTIVK